MISESMIERKEMQEKEIKNEPKATQSIQFSTLPLY